MDAKKKTTKKNIPPVDSRSYVVDSLSKASSAIGDAFNAINSTASSGVWEYGHSTVSSVNDLVLGTNNSTTFLQSNMPTVTGSSIQMQPFMQYVPYQDSTSLYPKVDIEKHWLDVDNYEYTVYIYLAGISKDRVQLKLERGGYIGTVFYSPKMTVHILPEKHSKLVPEHKTPQEWFLKESKQSFTTRVVNLPDDSDIQKATEALMENGVLVFHFPRIKNPEPPADIVSIKIL